MKTRRHAKDDLAIFSRIRETRKKKGGSLGCHGLSWCKTRGRRRKEIQTMFIFAKVQKVRSLGVRFLSDMPLLVSEVEYSLLDVRPKLLECISCHASSEAFRRSEERVPRIGFAMNAPGV